VLVLLLVLVLETHHEGAWEHGSEKTGILSVGFPVARRAAPFQPGPSGPGIRSPPPSRSNAGGRDSLFDTNVYLALRISLSRLRKVSRPFWSVAETLP
jgi:hypothetical protein